MSKYFYYNGSRIKDLRGQIFGDYKAIEVIGIKDKYAQWKCKCEKCGYVEIISANHIARGKICKPCKEAEKKRKKEEKHGNKLILEIGGKYDRWTIIKPVEGKAGNFYECKCEKCGTVKEIEAKILNRNTKAYSCKCTKTKNGVDPKNDLDLTDSSVFIHKNIKVLNKVSGFGSASLWKCKCLLCGKKWDVAQFSLLGGDVNSCGCYRSSLSSQNLKDWVGIAEGTSVSRIKSGKLSKNNTSGVTGVYYHKNMQKWSARIAFKGNTYFLGYYVDKQNAVDARKIAEKEFYGNFLEWYAKEYPEQWKRLNKNEEDKKDCD